MSLQDEALGLYDGRNGFEFGHSVSTSTREESRDYRAGFLLGQTKRRESEEKRPNLGGQV